MIGEIQVLWLQVGVGVAIRWSCGVLRLDLNDPLIKADPPLSGLIMQWGSGVMYRAAGGQSSCSMLITLQYTQMNLIMAASGVLRPRSTRAGISIQRFVAV